MKKNGKLVPREKTPVLPVRLPNIVPSSLEANLKHAVHFTATISDGQKLTKTLQGIISFYVVKIGKFRSTDLNKMGQISTEQLQLWNDEPVKVKAIENPRTRYLVFTVMELWIVWLVKR